MHKYLLPKIVATSQYDDITVRLLEPGHLEEDYPITITTFFKNKRFSSFSQTDQ